MIKLIASDLDGTLLGEDSSLHDEFYEVFEIIKQKNIIFAVATGRQYHSVTKKFNDIGDDIMYIAHNGTFVMYNNEEVLVNSLQYDDVVELVKHSRKINNVYIVLSGKKSAYIEKNDNEDFMKECLEFFPVHIKVDDLTKVDDEILTIHLYDLEGAVNHSIKYFEEYKDKVQICAGTESWLDLLPKEINKGVAIKKIQEKLGISYEETMVFGDYLNDLEMMESGYYSYAMENGHEELKKAARFIAKKNTENGVIEKIKEILEI